MTGNLQVHRGQTDRHTNVRTYTHADDFYIYTITDKINKMHELYRKVRK